MSIAIAGDDCPISEHLLFQIYDASKRRQPIPPLNLSAERKSMLAVFCYRRGHLEHAGLAIAATCEESDLLWAGGALGSVLFAKSRNYRPPPAPSGPSLKITPSSVPSIAADDGGGVEDELESVG